MNSSVLIGLLIGFYVLCFIGCITSLEDRDIKLSLPIVLLILCPIVNTIIAFKNANWDDVKRLFKRKEE